MSLASSEALPLFMPPPTRQAEREIKILVEDDQVGAGGDR